MPRAEAPLPNGILIPGRREQPNGLVLPPRAFHQPAVEAINKNAEAAKDWEYHGLYCFLTRWSPILVSELVDPIVTLDRENKPLPDPVISFDQYDYRVLAGYRLKRNPQGLLDQICFNTAHIKVEELKDNGVRYKSEWEYGEWFLLETTVHELLHLKQQNFGKHPVTNNYHNLEFRQMASRIGLHINEAGQHTQISDGAFAAWAERHGFKRPEIPPGEEMSIADFLKWLDFLKGKEHKRGKSTLTLYECPCGEKIRVGKKDWKGAKCLGCQGEYAKIEPVSRTLYQRKQCGADTKS